MADQAKIEGIVVQSTAVETTAVRPQVLSPLLETSYLLQIQQLEGIANVEALPLAIEDFHKNLRIVRQQARIFFRLDKNGLLVPDGADTELYMIPLPDWSMTEMLTHPLYDEFFTEHGPSFPISDPHALLAFSGEMIALKNQDEGLFMKDLLAVAKPYVDQLAGGSVGVIVLENGEIVVPPATLSVLQDFSNELTYDLNQQLTLENLGELTEKQRKLYFPES